ncbi:MAG: anti-sigma factor antagonist [Proteobacteria bacterium]|nr:anti-sigma factor antagonist [Pseudomonadota bacterium]
MRVRSIPDDGAIIVVVEGEVDLYSSPKLRGEIIRWAKKKASSMIVDLGAVTYMDSSGIATLVEGLQLTKKYGGKLKIARPDPSIQRVLKFAHLDKIFYIFNSVEEARAE